MSLQSRALYLDLLVKSEIKDIPSFNIWCKEKSIDFISNNDFEKLLKGISIKEIIGNR